MKNLIYITHDSWWNSDLPLFPSLSKYYRIKAFVFASAFHNKHFPVKESPYLADIYEFDRKYRLKNVLSFFSAVQFLFNIKTRSNKNDTLIYVFGDDFYFNFLFLLFFRKNKTIISLHNFNDHIDSPIYERIFKKIFLKYYLNFHFQSKLQHDQFCLKYDGKNSFYTNMPSKDFGEPQNRISIRKNNKVNFLFFGHIREYKRLDLLIEAANNSSIQAHFIIAGSCKNWSEIEESITCKEKFTYKIDFINNSEIADFFTQADFLVLPYSDTTQSGPLHIAFKYTLPIIASNLGGFSELITDGYNGYLFEVGNAIKLRECINKAATLSPEEYTLLKRNLRTVADNYDQSEKKIGEKFNTFIATYIS